MVLQRQLVSAIGRWFDGTEQSLPGLGMAMMMALRQEDGNVLVCQMPLNRSNSTLRHAGGSIFKMG